MRWMRSSVVIMTLLALSLVAQGSVGAAADPRPAADEVRSAPWPSTRLRGATAITADHGRFVVVGSGGKRIRPRAWVSEDGLSWTRAPDVSAPRDAKMSAVTGFEDGYVAVGTMEAPRRLDAGSRVVAWYSADGLEWERAVVMERPGRNDWEAVHADVVDGPAGLLGLGYFVEDHQLWRSTDGRTWLPTAAPDVDRVVAIAATPEAYLLTGYDSAEGLTIEDGLRLFMSLDGESWDVVAGAPPLTGVAASADGTVVGTGLPQLWATTDLEDWEPVWAGPEPSGTDDEGPPVWLPPAGYGGAITWTGSAFATTGSLLFPACLDEATECPPPPRLLSVDGFTWVDSAGPDGVPRPGPEASMVAAASMDGSTVILGRPEGAASILAWLVERPALTPAE